MKRLHLLRHAKSSWDDDSLPDRERPLAPRGVRASGLMAEHVAGAGLGVELVVCSPARRARDTLEPVLPALGEEVQVRSEPAVYGADAAELLEIVRGLPQEVASALVVGHNPGLESFARRFAADGQSLGKLRKKYPTGALASFKLDVRHWRRADFGRARLESFVRPRQLD
jgi:phosphohistidine phosphatase